MTVLKQPVPLTQRIYGSYLLLAAITLVLVVLSFLGLQRVERDFRLLQSVGESQRSGVELGRAASEIQRAVEFYIISGDWSNAEQVRDLYQQAMRDLEALSNRDLAGAETLIPRIRKHLDNLNNTFDQVQVQRSSSSVVVNERLPQLIQILQQQVAELLTLNPTAAERARVNEIWREVLLVERYMTRYFAGLNYEDVRYAKQHADNISAQMVDLELYELQFRTESGPAIELVDQMEVQLNEAMTVFNEGVQRVRGYLFLVNVVMAADSYEIGYLSNQLSKVLQTRLDTAQSESLSELLLLEKQLLIFGTLFLFTSILISFLMGRSIVNPISYLQKTFDRLSKGEKDIAIEYFPSRDEIAALASSAEAFRQANLATEALLKKYQELSEQLEQKVKERTRELEDANTRLEALSLTDALTHLNNRRSFEKFLADSWSRALRTGQPLSVIMIDIDHFKSYNDHYGHQQGDDCLKAVAAKLEEVFARSTDFVARYGGEEFVVVLENTALSLAEQMAEFARMELVDENLEHDQTETGFVTISLGVSSAWPAQSELKPEELVGQADEALYQSKTEGRNWVSTFTTEPLDRR